MPLHETERVIFELPLDDPNAGASEGFVVAIAPGGGVVFQLALHEQRLRAFSEERPPSCRMPADAAVALASELLRQLRPGLLEHLEVAERRAAMRVVSNGNDGGDAA